MLDLNILLKGLKYTKNASVPKKIAFVQHGILTINVVIYMILANILLWKYMRLLEPMMIKMP